jgi:hypothetical protein
MDPKLDEGAVERQPDELPNQRQRPESKRSERGEEQARSKGSDLEVVCVVHKSSLFLLCAVFIGNVN